MRLIVLLLPVCLVSTAPSLRAQGAEPGRAPLLDALFDFDDPFDDDVQNGMIRYEKALELCQSGVVPPDPAPSSLQQISTGGQGVSPNGSAEILPDPSPGRSCCGATGWISGRVAYDLKWDDILHFKASFFYDPPPGRPQVETLPASFKFENLWLENVPTSQGLLEIVTLTPGLIGIRDDTGFITGTLTRNDLHWYTADFTLTMPPGPGQSAVLSVFFADMGPLGDSPQAGTSVFFNFPADDLEAALCVMPFANFRQWAGALRIDNLEISSTLTRTSFESGDLGYAFSE